MPKLSVLAGSTSKLVDLFVPDSSSTVGAGLTGLVFNTASLTAYYYREGAASATAISLATMTLGTWATSGFVVIDGTNMPGCYQLGVPNAALAGGAKSVLIMLRGATNMAPVLLEIELTACDNQDGVRLGLTALPNAAAEASGGLYTRGTGAGQLNQPANGLVDVNTLRWNGTAVATPATAGVPDVNVKNMNNVAATSITTINANVGQTQPVNFTGTGASALVKSDMVDVAGAAVSTASAQLGVNAVNLGGTAQTGRDLGASVLLSSGTGTGQLSLTSGLVTLAAVTHTGARIPNVTLTDTVTTYTGNTVQTGDSYARIGAAGVSLSAIPDLAGVTTLLARLTALRAGYLDNVNNSALQTTVAQTGNVYPLVDTEIATLVAAAAAIQAKTDSLTFSVAGQVDANVQRINDVTITGDGSTTPFGV